ncbi:MAG TPA: hypothetical protein VN962_20715 [Polyangia bacterium]|nr:hypothetical protein [Polyangia bacterium]
MACLLILPVATALLANVPAAAPSEPKDEPLEWQPVNPPGAPAPAVPAAPQEPATHWYGGSALAIDGAVVLSMVTLSQTSHVDSSIAADVVYGAVAAYLLGGPIAHWVHGNATHSEQSLLLRLGGLAVGVAAVYAVASGSSGCNAEASAHASCPVAYGMVLALLAAMLIDDLALAREPIVQPPQASVSPRVLVQSGLAMFGVGGTF